jgi:hypothetical protein
MTRVLGNEPLPVEGGVWRYQGQSPFGVVEVLVRYRNGQWEHGDVDEPHLWETGWRLQDWPGTYQRCDAEAPASQVHLRMVGAPALAPAIDRRLRRARTRR